MLDEPANLAEWDFITQFTSLQAGYLWFGKQPTPWGEYSTPELIKAKSQEIAGALGVYPPQTTPWMVIALKESYVNKREKATRNELIELAKRWGEYPAFLFPEKRLKPTESKPSKWANNPLLSPATLQALEKYNAEYSSLFEKETVQAEPVSENSGRRDLQVQKIMGFIAELKYNPKQIPEGGKGLIEKRCLEIANLFSKDSFKKAWQEARDRGLIEVEGIDKYRPTSSGKA